MIKKLIKKNRLLFGSSIAYTVINLILMLQTQRWRLQDLLILLVISFCFLFCIYLITKPRTPDSKVDIGKIIGVLGSIPSIFMLILYTYMSITISPETIPSEKISSITKPSTQSTPYPTVKETGNGFRVILAKSNDRLAITSLKIDVGLKGVSPIIIKEGKEWIVFIGPYPSKESAEQAIQGLEEVVLKMLAEGNLKASKGDRKDEIPSRDDLSPCKNKERNDAYKFGLQIQEVIENRNVKGLINLIDDELKEGPRKKDLIGKDFSEIFSEEWRKEIISTMPSCYGGSRISHYAFPLKRLIFYEPKVNGISFSITRILNTQINFPNPPLPEFPGWKYDNTLLSPECFTYEWQSMDNYQEYHGRYGGNLKYGEFVQSIGHYIGERVPIEPITASWDESLSLAVPMPKCGISLNYALKAKRPKSLSKYINKAKIEAIEKEGFLVALGTFDYQVAKEIKLKLIDQFKISILEADNGWKVSVGPYLIRNQAEEAFNEITKFAESNDEFGIEVGTNWISEYANYYPMSYRVLRKISKVNCKFLAPKIKYDCVDLSLIELKARSLEQAVIYGIFKNKINDLDYVVPLANFDNPNKALNYIDSLAKGLFEQFKEKIGIK